MILWPNKSLSLETKQQFSTQSQDVPLGKLPDVLRKVRRRLWDKSCNCFYHEKSEQTPHTGQLNLLWDDPQRNPNDWESDFESPL